MRHGTVAAALRAGVVRLREAGIPDPARDARLLMADALGCEPGRLTLEELNEISAAADARFAVHIDQRAAHRPVSQILGRRWFWGLEFEVNADVLDPRPETELLVELALAGGPWRRILDLGTGSGALLVSLLEALPDAEGVGVDASPAALAVASRNASRHGLANRVEFRLGDWCRGLDGRFDLVVCNPPYIASSEIASLDRAVREWEPEMALSEGPTGLESYRRIAADLGDVLTSGGRALFEIGVGQGDAVREIFRAAGFQTLRVHRDLAGKPRCVDIYR